MQASWEDSGVRALAQATRSTRLLGIVSAALGSVIIVADGYLNHYLRFRLHFIAARLVRVVRAGGSFDRIGESVETPQPRRGEARHCRVAV